MFFKPSLASAEARKTTASKAEAETFDQDTAGLGYAGFETFGRAGLNLGGLHRDDQWVGSWGGRC